MKYIFIVNPASGNGKALKVVQNIKNVCLENKYDYEIHFTSGANDATKIARKYRFSQNIIFSVGGDGTLNEVVNGIVGSKNMLGVIPCGSGNDFYKTLDLIDDPMPLIDVGKINNKYFINIVSIGIDAEVADNVSKMKKIKIPPSQIYNASIVYTFFKYKFKNINVEIDENNIRNGKCTILTICNGRVYGGGYKIAPDALLTDGYFDVYFVDKIRKPFIPFIIGLLKKGTHESHKNVHKSKATRVKFKCPYDLVCNVDGEIIVDNKFDIKMLKSELLIYNDKKLIKRFLKG
ncbi:MAG: diacylglycerol kinase family lipid kinase [Bacilli bacterium]|nr:diacylglycerol kinase family lipid kinase [Bacilli bacterium]